MNLPNDSFVRASRTGGLSVEHIAAFGHLDPNDGSGCADAGHQQHTEEMSRH
jgi:hypothetical protein